jgi:hypothetical protein
MTTSDTIPAHVPKDKKDLLSSLTSLEDMKMFPIDFTAAKFRDALLGKTDEKYDEQLCSLRRKIYQRVITGGGEATVTLPPGVAKSMATTLASELRTNGFLVKYRKYRHRDHQALRQLKVRLPKGL